ncbi:MAG: class I adenylate-forming enzyme family protein [Luminiphilus sp.]
MSVVTQFKEALEMTTAPGGLLELTTIERDGVPVKAFAQAPGSMRDLWALSTAHGDSEYLVYKDERWTYAQAAKVVAEFAAWLTEQGIEPGDHVAIAMRNYPEWMMAHWAVNSIGAAVVGMNAWWVADELDYALNDSKSKVLIADDRRLEAFAQLQEKYPDITVVSVREANSPVEAIDFHSAKIDGAQLPELDIDPDSVACIFYTSGTTGRPKGAQLTNRGCVTNVLNVVAMGRTYATAAALSKADNASDVDVQSPPAATSLIATPLFHVTANNCAVQAGTLAGSRFVLMYKWDTLDALKLIEAEGVNTISAVPMMTRELLNHPEFSDYDTSSLASMGGGGAAMQPDLARKVDEQTKKARPAQGYGMTEVCGIITYIAGDVFLDRPESCGYLAPTFEGRVIDAEGAVLASGEVGEVCVKGAAVIKGYLNRPEATAETIVDGWLHTGDIGYFDEDGFLFLVDRAKDMILRGGENIYGAEVEFAVFDHPAVLECVAFAVPDDRFGEEVGAAIHLKDGAMLDAAGLREHLATRLAAFKVPRYIWFLAEPLPRNANGKFLKRELRDVLDPASAD